ncbi:MAG: laccase domain-containing protein, partial [Firmicutes bacterium]|nr:laccase domain-containing protein [Bacillota bacterium]
MSQIRLRDWERTGVVALFSRSDGGVSRGPYATLNVGLHVGDDASDVLTNRARLAAEAGLSERRIAYAEQVHGSGVGLVASADAGRGSQSLDGALPGVDALV